MNVDHDSPARDPSWVRRAKPSFRGAAPPPRLRSPHPAAEALGRLGSLEVRLAQNPGEVRRAQRLRFRVFCRELGAQAPGLAGMLGHDIDRFDAVCDHLVVLDHDAPTKRFRPTRPKVVGTYRLLRGEVAACTGGFYTATEFDLAPLLARHPGRSFVELGRSCVAPRYRDRRTVELLWAGIWAYVRQHGADAMIGCASLDGTDPARLALPLSYLRQTAPASADWTARPHPASFQSMDLLPPERIDRRAALDLLPPLLKAYLRIGATFGDGAAIDRRFGTTDVFVALPIERISARYLQYFGPDANRYAA